MCFLAQSTALHRSPPCLGDTLLRHVGSQSIEHLLPQVVPGCRRATLTTGTGVNFTTPSISSDNLLHHLQHDRSLLDLVDETPMATLLVWSPMRSAKPPEKQPRYWRSPPPRRHFLVGNTLLSDHLNGFEDFAPGSGSTGLKPAVGLTNTTDRSNKKRTKPSCFDGR